MLQAVLAAVGVATSAYGFFESKKSGKKMAKLAKQQYELQAAISAQTQKIEKIRQQQAVEDRLFAERNIIRNAQRARAQAVSNAVQGGNTGYVVGQGSGSSSLQGAFGGIAGATGESLTRLTGNFNRGQDIFAANARIAGYGGQINQLQSQIGTLQGQQNFGKELFNFGANLAQNSSQYAKTFKSIPGLFV